MSDRYLMTNTSELVAESYIDEVSGALVNKNVPIARTGIFQYLGQEFGFKSPGESVKNYRAYRDASSFSDDVIETFKGIPVTLNHPSEGIDTKNYQKMSVGHLNENVFLNDAGNIKKLFSEKFVIRDEKAIKAVQAGNKQVSIGFYATYDFTPGVSPSGESYDCTEKIIAANHVAIVVNGRGKAGPEYRLNSAIDYENEEKEMSNDMAKTSDESLMMIIKAQNATIENMTARITTLEKNSETRIKELADSIKSINEDYVQRSLKNRPSTVYEGRGGKGATGDQGMSEGSGDGYTDEMIDKFKGKNVNTESAPGKTTISDIGLNEKEEKEEEKDDEYDEEEGRPGVNSENAKYRKNAKDTVLKKVFEKKTISKNSDQSMPRLRTSEAFAFIAEKKQF